MVIIQISFPLEMKVNTINGFLITIELIPITPSETPPKVIWLPFQPIPFTTQSNNDCTLNPKQIGKSTLNLSNYLLWLSLY